MTATRQQQQGKKIGMRNPHGFLNGGQPRSKHTNSLLQGVGVVSSRCPVIRQPCSETLTAAQASTRDLATHTQTQTDGVGSSRITGRRRRTVGRGRRTPAVGITNRHNRSLLAVSLANVSGSVHWSRNSSTLSSCFITRA